MTEWTWDENPYYKKLTKLGFQNAVAFTPKEIPVRQETTIVVTRFGENKETITSINPHVEDYLGLKITTIDSVYKYVVYKTFDNIIEVSVNNSPFISVVNYSSYEESKKIVNDAVWKLPNVTLVYHIANGTTASNKIRLKWGPFTFKVDAGIPGFRVTGYRLVKNNDEIVIDVFVMPDGAMEVYEDFVNFETPYLTFLLDKEPTVPRVPSGSTKNIVVNVDEVGRPGVGTLAAFASLLGIGFAFVFRR